MNRGRQYRGGYQFAGLVTSLANCKTSKRPPKKCCGSCSEIGSCLTYKFRRQHQFGDYVADFYCHAARLVIECDGSVHDANEQWHHDQNRDAYMIAQGLRVLRFTNEQILNDTEMVFEEIASFLPLLLGEGRGEGRS